MAILRALLPRLTAKQFLIIGGVLAVLGGGAIVSAAVLIFIGARGGTLR